MGCGKIKTLFAFFSYLVDSSNGSDPLKYLMEKHVQDGKTTKWVLLLSILRPVWMWQDEIRHKHFHIGFFFFFFLGGYSDYNLSYLDIWFGPLALIGLFEWAFAFYGPLMEPLPFIDLWFSLRLFYFNLKLFFFFFWNKP